jgi:hypothetical protein
LGLRADSMAQFHDIAAWNQRQEAEPDLRVVSKRKSSG